MGFKKTLLKTAFLGGCSILGLGIGVSILDRYEEAHKEEGVDGAIDAKYKVAEDDIEDVENEPEESDVQE
jgi:hypothetical protein